MYKLIDSASFFPDDEVTVTLLRLKDVKSCGLEKVAADDRVTDYVKSLLKPKEGKFYLHINAMGAGEFYGSNKNADYFPEEQLKEYYKTFEETGYVYRHHINKDPAKSMGRVIYAIYNERMHRVELIAELDMVLGKDIYDRIQRGDFPQTSMACKTPWDVCSICSNKAHTRQEYCVHLTSQLNKVLPDGRKVMAMNVGPLRFFDISIVIKPADVTSSVLQKVAYSSAVSSALLAEEEGFVETIEKKAEKIKQAALKKFSEIIKKIPGGQITGASKDANEILSKVKEPGQDLLDILSQVPLEESLNALAQLGISPSVAFLASLIARKKLGHKVGLAFGQAVEEFISSIPPESIPMEAIDLLGDIEEKDASPHLIRAISSRSDASLTKEAIEKRAIIAELLLNQKPADSHALGHHERYHDGYLDTSKPLPKYISADQHERNQWRHEIAHRTREDSSTLSTILRIGGAALLAKMLLSSLLDEKIVKSQKEGLKYRGITSAVPLMEQSILNTYKR